MQEYDTLVVNDTEQGEMLLRLTWTLQILDIFIEPVTVTYEYDVFEGCEEWEQRDGFTHLNVTTYVFYIRNPNYG